MDIPAWAVTGYPNDTGVSLQVTGAAAPDSRAVVHVTSQVGNGTVFPPLDTRVVRWPARIADGLGVPLPWLCKHQIMP